MIADYERQTFSISPANWTLPLTSDVRAIYSPSYNITLVNSNPTNTSPNSVPIGVIVGSVVGGLVVLVLIIALLFFFLVLRRQRRAQAAALAKRKTVRVLKWDFDATEGGSGIPRRWMPREQRPW